ncbi:MAG: Nucleoside-diphosphate-sugar epimerase [Labilithrix sp.]|nr:Nucleoside-diphosphate-sugar epimerase [Labilithrix sp.]
MSEPPRVLVLGCGFTGAAVARLARGASLSVLAHVRSPERAAALEQEGFDVLLQRELDEGIAAALGPATHVVVAFPPDGHTDARIAPVLARAGAVTYVSSTGVYGEVTGVVDDDTPLPAAAGRSAAVLEAERHYRDQARAIVLRCPGIYGRGRGLHLRVVSGAHRIPGDGTRHLSRIHVEDLAAFVLASGREGLVRPDTFVVGDEEPAPHGDVVRWIAATYGVPVPPNVPLESVHESLRGDRRVDSARARAVLGVTLRYPTYREGMTPEATGMLPAR